MSTAKQASEDERLALARQLVAALEDGDEVRSAEAMTRLGAAVDASLFRALGTTARAVHDELVAYATDPQLSHLARTEAPDARMRLDHVITLTEEAAHRTMDAVERAQPLARAIAEDQAGDPALLLADARCRAVEIEAALGEVLLAQDYQDRTGQLIRRAIGLVETVEHRLVELLRVAGVQAAAAGAGPAEAGTINGFGPRVAQAGDDALASQQQVDDLLESLGF
jgi:chemotaxis protein CheZ